MCDHTSYRLVKTNEYSYRFQFRYKDPGSDKYEYGTKIYEDFDLSGPLNEFYQELNGKEKIEIWNIEIEPLYKRVYKKPRQASK